LYECTNMNTAVTYSLLKQKDTNINIFKIHCTVTLLTQQHTQLSDSK
jgi:hypothetical protein